MRKFLRFVLVIVAGMVVLLQSACQASGLGPGQPTPTFPSIPVNTPTRASPTAEPKLLPPPVVVTGEIKSESVRPDYQIRVLYPRLERYSDPRFELFNQVALKTAEALVSGFKQDVEKMPPPDPSFTKSSLKVTYNVTHGSAGILSVKYTAGVYMSGAAHPNSFTVVFNLDLVNQKELVLAELFKPGVNYLNILSGYCLADLKKRGSLAWDNGALPLPENFDNWNISPDGILITFDPYEVAPYASGPQAVTVPFDILKSNLNLNGPLAAIVK